MKGADSSGMVMGSAGVVVLWLIMGLIWRLMWDDVGVLQILNVKCCTFVENPLVDRQPV